MKPNSAVKLVGFGVVCDCDELDVAMEAVVPVSFAATPRLVVVAELVIIV